MVGAVKSRVLLKRCLTLFFVVPLAAVVLAACGSTSDGGDSSGSTSSTSGGTTTSSSCGGSPIKVMTIWSNSGTFAGISGPNEVPNAAKAAETAVNAECALGRPIEVNACDDQSTSTGSLECGREAAKDGTLALIGFADSPAGSQGAEAANLPGIFTRNGGGAWDNTSSLSYPNTSSMTTVGAVRTAAALGAKSYSYIAFDTPEAKDTGTLGEATAKDEGIKYSTTYLPATTTDYTSYAAQLAQEAPETFSLGVAGFEPFIKSFWSVGGDLTKTQYVGIGGLSPTVREELGSKLVGYEVASVVPTSASTNEGIEEMKSDYEAAGIEFSSQIAAQGVQEWSAVKMLEEALEPLAEGGELEELTTESLLEAVVDHGTYEFPTTAPFNYEKTASFENPTLKKVAESGRTFTNVMGVFKFEGAEMQQVGEWQNLNEKFTLKE